METIFVILMFVAPGMIVRELTYYFVKERRLKGTVYAYLFDIVVDSVVINGAVIFAINKRHELSSFELMTDFLNSFKNLAIYAACIAVASVAWCAMRNLVIRRAALWIKNKLLSAENKPIHTVHTTVWDDLMANESFNGTWQVVSLFKDEKYLTSGMIDTTVTTNAPEFELMLDRVTETKKMMDSHPEIFKTDYEYYNVSTGLRVVVYRQKYIEEHWDYEL